MADIQTFIDKYTGLCSRKKLIPIQPVINQLSISKPKDTLDLKGNQKELQFSRINDDALDALSFCFATTPFLRELDLSFNDIGDRGIASLASFLKSDKLLEVLILKSNSIGGIGCLSLCEALHDNPRINYLDISDNNLDDEGGMAIAKMIQVNTALTNLFVSGCKFKASSLLAIYTVVGESKLIQQLDISNNVIPLANHTNSLSKDCMTYLSIMIRDNTSIKILDISKMSINDDALMTLIAPALNSNKTIEYLNLSSNRIGRDGCVALCKSLHKNLAIQVLKLSCCSVQDEGAEAVAQLLLENASIQEIYLDYNKITNSGLHALGKSISKTFNLKYVAVWGNQWGKESSQTFHQMQQGKRLSPNSCDVCFREIDNFLHPAKVERK